MKDMEKDGFIEEKIASYVEGTSPEIDLTAAKRALAEETARRRVRRRRRIALLSACASLVLVAAVFVGVLFSLPIAAGSNDAAEGGDHGGSAAPPGDDGPAEEIPGSGSSGGSAQAVFEMAAAEKRETDAAELSEAYGSKLEKLTALGLSQDVEVVYTLYYADGQAVLLGTEIVYKGEGGSMSAVVYTDLSAGIYRAAELEEYASLPQKTDTYCYKETYSDGEYVTMGAFSLMQQSCCVQVRSSSISAFTEFMQHLLR